MSLSKTGGPSSTGRSFVQDDSVHAAAMMTNRPARPLTIARAARLDDMAELR
jgi:hypothetical protein